jgi:hypothetical protein
MLPPAEKTFSKHQKIPNKNLAHTSRHSMYMRQVIWKTDIFCVLCKKDKILSHATPILAPNFIFFLHTTHKISFFHKTTL